MIASILIAAEWIAGSYAVQAGAETEFINGRELSLQGAGLAVSQMYTQSVCPAAC